MSAWHEITRRAQHAWHELFIGVDQLANVVIFAGNLGTYADETLSARAWRQSRNGAPARWVAFRIVVDALFAWQDAYLRIRSGRWPERRHCERAYNSEQLRLGMPPEYRSTTRTD